ncbi:MAG: dTDP-4-dehydrorhamnose reductase [Thermoflavifilum sp.]|nr:dTDP-4-dehydrorhamnose reductase [Thermoflavifilum sp.]
MRILLTGANGLLGQHVLQSADSNTDHEWIALGRGPCRFSLSPLVKYISADITDKNAIQEIFQRHQPQAVLHAAAMTHVDACEQNPALCWAINVEGTYHLLLAAQELNCFFLLVSTDFIFDGKAGPYGEEDLPNPINYYGLSKLCAEQLVRGSHLDWAIARTVLVYGYTPGREKNNIVRWIIEQLEQGKTLHMVDDQWRTPTWAADLATGCLQLLNSRATGIFHLAGLDMLTPYQMAQQIAQIWQFPEALIQPTNSQNFQQPARRPLRTGLRIEKAQQQIHYTPHGFVDSLHALYHQWLSQSTAR